jgi:hypothetical protein
MLRRTVRLPRTRTCPPLLRPAEEAASCRIPGHAPALPSVRRKDIDLGQFLQSTLEGDS